MAHLTPSLGYPVVSPLLATSAPLADLVVGPWYEGGRVSPLGSCLAPAAKKTLVMIAQHHRRVHGIKWQQAP